MPGESKKCRFFNKLCMENLFGPILWRITLLNLAVGNGLLLSFPIMSKVYLDDVGVWGGGGGAGEWRLRVSLSEILLFKIQCEVTYYWSN